MSETNAAVVSPEFHGMARQFRNRVIAADEGVSDCIHAIARDLKGRAQRRPRVLPRPEHCVEMANRLARVGRFGRFSLITDRQRRGWRLSNMHLVGNRLTNKHWEADQQELSVAIVNEHIEFSITATGCEIRFPMQVVAIYGLHAIARYYQRGPGMREDAVLLEALSAAIGHVSAHYHLISTTMDKVQLSKQMRIQVAGGHWLGSFGKVATDGVGDQWPVVVRTFI